MRTATDVANLARDALKRLPEDKTIDDYWQPEWRVYLKALKSFVSDAADAEANKWDQPRISSFEIGINAVAMGLSTGYGMGIRDGTGGVFWTVFADDGTGSPTCGPAPAYTPGASCSLKCSQERQWCLCKEGCGSTIDCSSWPCTECFDCNLNHAICAADCLLSLRKPPERFINPDGFRTARLY